jgi:urease accessory protein
VATDRDPHHPVVLGTVSAAAGLTPQQAGAAACYNAVSGPAAAALRLLGLDPAQTAKVVAVLAAEMDEIAASAARAAKRPLAQLPSWSAPAADYLAEAHYKRKDRLFAS